MCVCVLVLTNTSLYMWVYSVCMRSYIPMSVLVYCVGFTLVYPCTYGEFYMLICMYRICEYAFTVTHQHTIDTHARTHARPHAHTQHAHAHAHAHTTQHTHTRAYVLSELMTTHILWWLNKDTDRDTDTHCLN